MMRKLLATTAIAGLLATGAYAQTTTQPAPATPPATEAPAQMVEPAEGHLATNLIGESVYNGTADDAQNIGEVNDLVIGPDGKVKSIVVGVGGFLGIGQKNVEVDYSTLDWAEKNGDRWIVIAATPEQLKELPAFDTAPYMPAPPVADATPPATTTTPAPADQTAQAPANPAPADQSATPPAATDQTAAIDKSTLKPLDTTTIKSEDFVGTTVYGANDERIGEIGDVVLANDKVDAVILDVGGFLGVGEKPVAVGMDNLAFMTDENGNRYLYTTFTKEQLDAAPAFDESTFAEKRDEMRIVVPN